jgi:hypothetical protein
MESDKRWGGKAERRTIQEDQDKEAVLCGGLQHVSSSEGPVQEAWRMY